MKLQNLIPLAALVLSVFASACADSETAVVEDVAAAPLAEAPAAVTAPAAETLAPTGKVIEVDMITDAKGNYFEPAQISAEPGDVLRFNLVSGVHNVSFPADRNAGASGLPAATEYLQLPGQSVDVPVNLESGEYTFVCDPHAALGMVGTLTVQ